MTFARLAVLSALLAMLSAPVSALRCAAAGNVTLLWGTILDNADTATPIGFSTSATAPVDDEDRSILAVRATIPSNTWTVFNCVGELSSGGGGGGGGGPVPRTGGGTGGGGGGGGAGGGSAAGNTTTMVGSIADPDANLCLTAEGLDRGNITVSHRPCISPPSGALAPDLLQRWQWTATRESISSLVYIGDQLPAPVPEGIPTNYAPSLVGTGVGAYVAFGFEPAGFTPSTVTPGIIIDFVCEGAC